ncbi:MAG: exodeoxyribonuclease I [bacterium]
MDTSFFFYDLETTGLNPREARIMQFAGQRTDMNLELIGDPINILIKQSEDCLPDPGAILITGITPQKTLKDGITEDEFIKQFNTEIAIPGTIFIGYNSISFDDEFIRFLLYRNLYDAYEWQWKEGRSKWDLLDIIRITRALRPEGIKWPIDFEGKSNNQLEKLASENNILHTKAHDAMSDVEALIGLAKLIKIKQPKLFDFMLSIRDKKSVSQLVLTSKQFLYTSGSFSSDHEKTSIVSVVEGSQDSQGVLVYDLTLDPDNYKSLSVDDLVAMWQYNKDYTGPRLPIKKLQFNRCPSIAPLAVLRNEDAKRLKLDRKIIDTNYKKLLNSQELITNILKARKVIEINRENTNIKEFSSVESKLYDGFIGDEDKRNTVKVHSVNFDYEYPPDFNDKRLSQLYPLFVARNYPDQKTDEIDALWQKHKINSLLKGEDKSKMANYLKSIADIQLKPNLTSDQIYLMEELKLWAEAIMPVDF